ARKRFSSSLYNTFAILAVALSVISVHPTAHAIYRLVNPNRSGLPMVNFYVKPSIEATPLNPPNIVWIYGESLERTYLDESAFPGLMPNLKEIESESLSFTDIEQVGSSGWTIAGLVASQCGIPLVVTGGDGNSMDSMPTFLPGATCIGDLLKKASYTLTFMGGADTVFAGKGKFFRTHGFDEVLGSTELLPLIEDKKYRNDWGLFDDSLLGLGLKKFDSLLAMKKPFGLFMLTLDTHHPVGYMSKECGDLVYGDGSDPILNAVHCSDRLIAKTVREIVRKDPNTLVIVGSDHLAMPNTVYEKLTSLTRKDLLLFHWPSRLKTAKNSRMGSTYSSGATVLDVMGFETAGIGLGRSMLGDRPTLRESIPNVQEAMSGWDHEFRKFWSIPENPKSIHIDPTRQFVSFSGSLYKLPLIVDISESEKYPRLYYENKVEPLSDVITKLGPETRSIWLDNCERVLAVIEKNWYGSSKETCVWDDKLRKITRVESAFEYALK
ncbi:MAG: hypothetical protein EOP04_16185, partial [Proteobacteria bacterium]